MRAVVILIADDNPTDLMIMREAFAESQKPVVLHTVSDGESTLNFLHKKGVYAEAPRPDMILLDLNMPRKNGYEVLTDIKSDPLLKSIPVVMLTTSPSEADVAKAYAANVNCYIRKPVDFERFSQVVRTIEEFWFNVATLPRT